MLCVCVCVLGVSVESNTGKSVFTFSPRCTLRTEGKSLGNSYIYISHTRKLLWHVSQCWCGVNIEFKVSLFFVWGLHRALTCLKWHTKQDQCIIVRTCKQQHLSLIDQTYIALSCHKAAVTLGTILSDRHRISLPSYFYILSAKGYIAPIPWQLSVSYGARQFYKIVLRWQSISLGRALTLSSGCILYLNMVGLRVAVNVIFAFLVYFKADKYYLHLRSHRLCRYIVRFYYSAVILKAF